MCITLAFQMVYPLELGIDALKKNKQVFQKMNPENGFGSYEILLSVAQRYLAACIENPNAEVEVSR